MSEATMDLASLGITVGDAPTSTAPADAPSTQPSSDSSSGPKSAQASSVDDTIKDAIRKNITNHELACLVVDIVSPGQAIERMGGAGLDKLPPMQHLIIACTAIGGTVLLTNPDLAKKLVRSLKSGGKKQEALPEGQHTMTQTPPALAPQAMLEHEVAATHAPAAAQRDSHPDDDSILRDLSGRPL